MTLSFNKKLERLSIPFDALVSFADPAVGFGLQFQPPGTRTAATADDEDDDDPTSPGDGPEGGEPAGQVISLDAFRKKT